MFHGFRFLPKAVFYRLLENVTKMFLKINEYLTRLLQLPQNQHLIILQMKLLQCWFADFVKCLNITVYEVTFKNK
jgi:hypothetical protein